MFFASVDLAAAAGLEGLCQCLIWVFSLIWGSVLRMLTVRVQHGVGLSRFQHPSLSRVQELAADPGSRQV